MKARAVTVSVGPVRVVRAVRSATFRSSITRHGAVRKPRWKRKRAPRRSRIIGWRRTLRYNQRSSAERVNSTLKDNGGGAFVRVRGHAKVFCHLMFGIAVATAEQLLRLIT